MSIEENVRIIKKYPNRRLYDSAVGSYVTLEDIKKLVLQHVEFKVLDAKTNVDITQATLLQIISEQENSASPMFTTNVLQDFIRFYHEKSQSAFADYLEHALKFYDTQKTFFNTQWETYEKLLKETIDSQSRKDK